jgi:hypothetical protein
MTYRMYGAIIASLGVVTLLLAANETFAKPGSAPPGVSSTHFRASAARSLRHHRRNNVGPFWSGVDGSFYGSPNGEPLLEGSQASGEVRHTYTYDVPWDWAHRYPPSVTPSDRPYVPSCPSETVTVAGRDGKEQTVNIMRCY